MGALSSCACRREREKGGGRKKSNWVGRSLFVAGRKNRETSEPVKTNIPVHRACKSAVVWSVEVCEGFPLLLGEKCAFVGCFLAVVGGNGQTDITQPLLWRDSEQ